MTRSMLLALRAAHSALPPVLVYRSSEDGAWYVPHGYAHTDPVLGPLRVPPGFRFDLASIPRPARPLIGIEELSIVAPMFHDAGYHGALRWADLARPPLTRREVDDLFLRLMKVEGVPKWRWTAAYQAVRWFGGGAWDRHRRATPPTGDDERVADRGLTPPADGAPGGPTPETADG